MTELDQGIERWGAIARTLNEIIENTGQIDINNEVIWKGFLHSWENEDWELVLSAVAHLLEQHPSMFKSFHKDAFLTAANVLVSKMDSVDRVLDRKYNKKTAWKMIMTLRELWNQAHGTYLPNDNSSRKRNEFHAMFN